MITKAKAKEIHAEIDAAMATIAAQHGLQFVRGNARFNEGMFRLKVELKDASDQLPADSLARITGSRFNHYATQAGCQRRCGDRICVQGTYYDLVEWRPSRPKFPIVAARVHDNKRFKMSVDTVNQANLIGHDPIEIAR